MDLTDHYDFAVQLAEKAGHILLDRYYSDFKISYKSKNKTDLVTEVDHLAENFIIGAIKKKFPKHAILSEESGALGAKKSDFRWIIDPLDGTVNYAHGFPHFSVSVALEYRGEIVIGVVNAPYFEQVFRAAKGNGVFLNDIQIGVSSARSLDVSLLTTGFPYQQRERNLPYFEHFLLKSRGMRRLGSAALDLAYVAWGRVDAYWEIAIKAWDIAAGKLLVEEAGGKVTNMDGSAFDLNGENVLATNGFLHEQMIENIRSCLVKPVPGGKKVPFWK
jgi:myo-inositol-1(or 4)-monophosphatase